MAIERKASMIMESTRGEDGAFLINVNIEGDFDAADAVGHICKLAESFAEALAMVPERMIWLCMRHCDKFFIGKEGDGDGEEVPERTGSG